MRLINLKNLLSQKNPDKKSKELTFEMEIRLSRRRQKVLNGFDSKIFSIAKQIKWKGRLLDLPTWIEILTPKWILERLPIAVS